MSLAEAISPAPDRRITVQLVQKEVAHAYGMSVAQLLERTRRREVAHPRHIAMYFAAKLTPASTPDIGHRFGGFDHTTVLYARDMVAQKADKDPSFAAALALIEKRITQ